MLHETVVKNACILDFGEENIMYVQIRAMYSR